MAVFLLYIDLISRRQKNTTESVEISQLITKFTFGMLLFVSCKKYLEEKTMGNKLRESVKSYPHFLAEIQKCDISKKAVLARMVSQTFSKYLM
jgi:hypothetical protein